MELLVYIGTAFTVIGLLGIGWSAVKVTRLRRAELDEDAAKQQLRKILPLNLGSLMVSLLGLVLVLVGVLLSG